MSSAGGGSAPSGGGGGFSVRSGGAEPPSGGSNAALVSRLMRIETPAGSSAAHAQRESGHAEVEADPTPATPNSSGVEVPAFSQPRPSVGLPRTTHGPARYNRQMMTVPGDRYDHRRRLPDRPHESAPHSVADYVRGRSFDSERFGAVPVAQRARNKKGRAASYDARWAHWASRGPKDGCPVGTTDSPYVRMREEYGYQARQARQVDFLDREAEETARTGVERVFPQWGMLAFDRPFNALWFLSRGQFWSDCVDFEHRRRTGRTGLFAGWHNIELDDIPRNDRDRFFVQVPAWFRTGYEVDRLLQVPTPPIFAYYTSLVLRGSIQFANLLMDVVVVEYVAFVLLALLDGAEFGLRVRREEDVRAYREYTGADVPGRLCRIPPAVREMIERLGVFSFLEHTEINPIRAWVAFRTAECIAWSDQLPFVIYDWTSGQVSGLPEAVSSHDGRRFSAQDVHWLAGVELPTTERAEAALAEWRRVDSANAPSFPYVGDRATAPRWADLYGAPPTSRPETRPGSPRDPGAAVPERPETRPASPERPVTPGRYTRPPPAAELRRAELGRQDAEDLRERPGDDRRPDVDFFPGREGFGGHGRYRGSDCGGPWSDVPAASRSHSLPFPNEMEIVRDAAADAGVAVPEDVPAALILAARLLQPEDGEGEETANVERERLIAERDEARLARARAETDRAAAESEARAAREGGTGLRGGLVRAFDEGYAEGQAAMEESVEALRNQVEFHSTSRVRALRGADALVRDSVRTSDHSAVVQERNELRERLEVSRTAVSDMRERAVTAETSLVQQTSRAERAEAALRQMRERAERAERLVAEQPALVRSAARAAAGSVGQSASAAVQTFLVGLDGLRTTLTAAIAAAPSALPAEYRDPAADGGGDGAA